MPETDDAPTECPECGANYLVVDTKRAELVCPKCFLVVAEVLAIPGTETEIENDVRVRSSDEDRLLPQYRFGPKDASGKPVEHNLLWKYRRAARTHNLRPSERTILSMEANIRRLGALREIPHGLVERAVNLYRRCKAENTFRKPSLDEWALALLLTACREAGYVVTVGGLVDETQSAKKVLDYHHGLVRAFGLRARLPDVSAYVVYFAGRLGVAPDSAAIKHALHLSALVASPNVSPQCIAAASLYIAVRDAGLRVTQRALCRVANISEISLRHWSKRVGGYRARDTAPAADYEDVLPALDDGGHEVRARGEERPEQ